MELAITDDQNGKALWSLADVSSTIENRRYLSDVSDMNLELLEQILPHCSKTQLTRIEKSTKHKDLSPVTDRLWKSFYEKEFGIESTESVMEIMKERNLKFKWSELYQEKSKRVNGAEKKEDDRKKLSRQLRVCQKVPLSSSNKKKWIKKKFGGPKRQTFELAMVR